MGGVDDEHIGACRDQSLGALVCIDAHAHSGADSQAAVRVLRRLRELDALLNVLDRDQALDAPFGVDDRQLLDAVAMKQLLGLGERGSDRSSHEAL